MQDTIVKELYQMTTVITFAIPQQLQPTVKLLRNYNREHLETGMQLLRNCNRSLSSDMASVLDCRTEILMPNGHVWHSIDANRMCHTTGLMPKLRSLQKSRAKPTLSRNCLQFLGNANVDKDLQRDFFPFLQLLGNHKLPSIGPNTRGLTRLTGEQREFVSSFN